MSREVLENSHLRCLADATMKREVPQSFDRGRTPVVVYENVICVREWGHPGFCRSFTGWEWDNDE